MKAKVTFYHLSDWGLSLAALSRLGDCLVRLKAYVRHPREAALFRLPPETRCEAIRKARLQRYRALVAWWPNSDHEPIGRRREPVGVRGLLPARLVPRLRSLPLGDVWIENIEGQRRLPPKPQAPEFFAVQARFGIQVEGRTRGMQQYEDRIVLVQASTPDEAVTRLRKPFATYGSPYLNPRGHMVRWAFEKVLDVYSTSEERIDPAGTEVFSQLRKRRMRPEHVWTTVTSTNRARRK